MKIENFDIGDKVYRIEYPNQIFTVIEKSIDGPGYFPWYTLTDGKTEWDTLCINYKKVFSKDDVLKDGEILTKDIYMLNNFEGRWIMIYTIRYKGHIFYFKKVNDEIIEFKELTV